MNTLTKNRPSRLGSKSFEPFLYPFLFVVLYGSGFVGAKYGLPYSSPLSFLTLRFMIAGLLFAIIVLLLKLPIPNLKNIIHISIAGSLTVAAFSIGVFISIDMGLSPALSALVIALQPILVGVFASRMIGERLQQSQWLGLIFGLIGVAVVVAHNIDTESVGVLSISMSIIGLLGLTAGNLYQKRFCSEMNIITGGSIQSLASGIICLILLVLFDEYSVEWTPQFIGALTYMTLGVSLGALSLLYIMIRRGEVSKVASIFYLVPVSAAITAYFLYGETFDLFTLVGAVIIFIGIYLTNRG